MEIIQVSHATTISAGVPASVPESSGFSGFLPSFQRSLQLANTGDFASVYPPDAGLYLRLDSETAGMFAVADFTTGLTVNGSSVNLPDGSPASFFRLHVVHILVGRIDVATAPTGTVDIELVDLFADSHDTAADEGDTVICSAFGRAPTINTAIAIDFNTSTGYVVEILLAGRKSTSMGGS